MIFVHAMNKYRTITSKVESALDTFRVVSVTGARQVGKSTLARRLCVQRNMVYVSLENAVARAAAIADADAWLDGFSGPVAIDEIQHAPDLFRAIKRRVDASNKPGQYLITGSALWLAMRAIGETLAGRVALLELWPFSLAEKSGLKPFDFGFLLADDWNPKGIQEAMKPAQSSPRQWWRKAIMYGGFPEPAKMADTSMRDLWFESYLDTYLKRDVLDLVRIEHADLFVRLIRLLAVRSGQLLNISTLARDAGLPIPTARRYAEWLVTTYQRFDILPYSTNTAKRLVRTPKSYWSDTGMLTAITGWRDWRAVESAGADGAMLETWVAGELRKWSAYGDRQPIHFWRSHGGAEADFVLERQGRVTAIEVKTGHRIDARDMKGLAECREVLGGRFHRGIILYGGTEIQPIGDRLYAVPLDILRGNASGVDSSRAIQL